MFFVKKNTHQKFRKSLTYKRLIEMVKGIGADCEVKVERFAVLAGMEN